MKNKYNMEIKDNIFFAKRKLVDNIYQSAILEGIKVTFADIYSFVNNVNTGKIAVLDMFKLKGLVDAWEYVLNNIQEDLTIDFIKKVHFEICKYGNVELSKTIESDYETEFKNILKIPNDLERSISIFCWLQINQMFQDGNKRVANLVANHEMIKHGQGIIMVPVSKIDEYVALLRKYYETNDMTDIKTWIYENCIDGIDE